MKILQILVNDLRISILFICMILFYSAYIPILDVESKVISIIHLGEGNAVDAESDINSH